METPPLRPLSFHEDLRATVREQEPGLWGWFASDEFGREQIERVRLELLKDTYRLDVESHGELHRVAVEVAHRLGVDVPVHLYQGGVDDGTMNAGLCFVPGEVHIVLKGPILSRLDPGELRALFGHEISHYVLCTEDGGEHRIAQAVVETVAGGGLAPPSWVHLAIRKRLYTEVYADRGSLVANEGDLHAAIRVLLKVTVGLEAPDAVNYLRQVDEVVGKSLDGSRGETHPELFLRAWAMRSWLAEGPKVDPALMELVQGASTLEGIDLVGQVRLTERTRGLILRFLRPRGLRTEAVMAHARAFFPDLVFPDRDPLEADGADGAALGSVSASVAEYLGYVLLDLVTADPEMLDEALAGAVVLAHELGFGSSFEELARKELRVSARQLGELRKGWPILLERLRQMDPGAS